MSLSLCNRSLHFSLPLSHLQQQPLPSKARVEYSCGSVEYTTTCSTQTVYRPVQIGAQAMFVHIWLLEGNYRYHILSPNKNNHQ